MTQDMTQRGLHTSASNAQADNLCYGRHLAQRDLPEVVSEDADHGVKIHDALKKQDWTMLDISQVETYEACNSIEQKMVDLVFPEARGLKSNPIRENRMWIKWQDGLMHSAQVDSFHRSGTKALIVEYKTLPGQQAVSQKNMQLRDQVCVVDANYPLLDEIAVVVVQPLVTHSPEITIYRREDIERAKAELYLRVRRSNTPGEQRTAGEVQCKFCKARFTCVEYNKWAGEMAISKDSQPLEIQMLLHTAIEQWTPMQRSMFLDRASAAARWVTECKSKIKELMKLDPNAVPGYELKDGARQTKITNPEAVYASYEAIGGKLSDFMNCITVSKTDLKDAVRASTGLKGKKLEDALISIIGTNCKTSQNEPSITRKE